jgi:hypothetical protein
MLALVLARPASAALTVPMCGEHAQTIAAPPSGRAANPTFLTAKPCEQRAASALVSGAPEPRPEPVPPLELTPRIAAVSYDLGAFVGDAHGLPRGATGGERSAHSSSIERPPR